MASQELIIRNYSLIVKILKYYSKIERVLKTHFYISIEDWLISYYNALRSSKYIEIQKLGFTSLKKIELSQK